MRLDNLASYRESRQAEGLWRQLQTRDSGALLFCSNDYLGLSQHPRVLAAFKRGLDTYGAGSGGSPLVCGYEKPHAELCEVLADWLGRDRVLLFNSGYAANHGILQTLSDPGTSLIFDKLNHASLYDGAKASQSPLLRFPHNDLKRLKRNLDTLPPGQDALVVSEGVFSMDGDTAPLEGYLDTLASSDRTTWLWLDDAHGLGVSGAEQAGVCAQATQQQLPIVSATFGKAFGLGGAFVAGSSDFIDALTQRARHFIYSTAFSAAQACAALAALQIIRDDNTLQQRLQSNIRYFRQAASSRGIETGSHSPIQPVIVGSNERALKLSDALAAEGISCKAIRPPTVPPNTARLRFTLSARHSEQDIDRVFKVLDLTLAAGVGG